MFPAGQEILRDEMEIAGFSEPFPEDGAELLVYFKGIYCLDFLHQGLGQRTQARPHFHHDIVCLQIREGENLVPAVPVNQEILAQTLLCPDFFFGQYFPDFLQGQEFHGHCCCCGIILLQRNQSMKTLIVYFSLTGNTEKLAAAIGDYLKAKNITVDFLRLKSIPEDKNFFKNCLAALFKKKVRIEAGKFDLKDYQAIFFGTPVWAFDIVPALRTYLDTISDLSGKKVFLFATYGSGAGKERALNNLEKIVKGKKGSVLGRLSICEKDITNASLLQEKIPSFCTFL